MTEQEVFSAGDNLQSLRLHLQQFLHACDVPQASCRQQIHELLQAISQCSLSNGTRFSTTSQAPVLSHVALVGLQRTLPCLRNFRHLQSLGHHAHTALHLLQVLSNIIQLFIHFSCLNALVLARQDVQQPLEVFVVRPGTFRLLLLRNSTNIFAS